MSEKLKACCWIFNAIVLVHVLAFPLKLIQPFLNHCVLSLLRCDLAKYLQNAVLLPFLESCAENSHYSLSILTVMLVFYVAWFYCNGLNPNPFVEDLPDYLNRSARTHEIKDFVDMVESLELRKVEDIVQKCIGNNWDRLARRFGFTESEIDNIINSDQTDLCEQIAQLFIKWHRSKGNGATKDALLTALAAADLDEKKIAAALKESAAAYKSTNTLDPRPPLMLPGPPTKLTGLNIIAEKSHCDSQDFPWKGLMLTVPAASPVLTVQVSSGGNVGLPANTELVSALYSITFNEAAPGCDLSVGFQHSACVVKESMYSRLQIVVAKLPQTSPSYQLLACTEKTSTSVSDATSSIRLPCLNSQQGYLIGLVKPWTRYWVFAGSNVRSKYYLRAVVHSVSNSEREMHIIVVKHLDPYIQLIDSTYPVEKYVSYGECEVSLQEHSPKPFFQSSLSFSHVNSSCKEWKAKFTTPAAISRSKLEKSESYTKSGSQLPRVTINFRRSVVEGVTEQEAPSVACKVKLSGTAPPFSCSCLSLAPLSK